MRGSSKTQLNSAEAATVAAVAPPREAPKARAFSWDADGAERRPGGAARLSRTGLGAGTSDFSDPRLAGTGYVALAL